MARDEVHDERVAAELVERVGEQADVPFGLRHLLVVEAEHPVVHPQPREGLPAPGLRLRDLVLVVGEDEVRAAAVDVEVEPKELLGHRGALDVPPRPPGSPGRVPRRVLTLLLRLPEGEVARILLQREVGVVALALVHLVLGAVRELAVLGKARDAEIDVAAGLVGGVTFDERLDQRHDPRDRLGGLRFVVGPADAEA